MKNLKKILALLLCFVLVLSLTACGTGTVSTVSSTGTLVVTEGKVDPSAADYANDIDGLVSYMKDCEVITGEATDMSADFIGAAKGKQFCFTYGDATITVEFYEYDLDNMSEKATSCLEGVKTAQKLDILGKTIEARANAAGKFVMIYTCSAEGDVYAAFTERVNNLFTAFEGK